ncbi:hypothetical protein ACFLXD_02615 [Chloroflexota bacterium]
MRTDAKVLLSNLAAYEECGKLRIDYPVEHSLIFYLSEHGFKFPTYNFVATTWSDYSNTLLSRQLEQDIDTLVTRGVLDMTENPSVSITDTGIEQAKSLVEIFRQEGEDYELLRTTVKEALMAEPNIFLEKCYMMYIRKEYSLAEK